jgi:hypothetical protein
MGKGYSQKDTRVPRPGAAEELSSLITREERDLKERSPWKELEQ